MYRHCYLHEQENIFLAKIRDRELKDPAPFSNNKLVDFSCVRSSSKYPFVEQIGDIRNYTENVPVCAIVGLDNTNNLDNFREGMTFRDVLFNCLHGASLTKESLKYFLSKDLKSDQHEWARDFVAFPQNEKYRGKAYARRCVGLTKRGNVFYVDQGKQRTIMAMFYLYQERGRNALFQNVRVNRYS